MKKIGIFGGTFDPVHLGHTSAAQAAAEQFGLDLVIFVPTSKPPHKPGNYEDGGVHRYNMVQIACADNGLFAVSDFEIRHGGTSYTYITAEYFREKYRDDELYFILGDEAYNQIDAWKNPERVRAALDFIVVTRCDTQPPRDALFLNIAPIPISSTEVRRRIAVGEDASQMLNGGVYEYILKHNLYKG